MTTSIVVDEENWFYDIKEESVNEEFNSDFESVARESVLDEIGSSNIIERSSPIKRVEEDR